MIVNTKRSFTSWLWSKPSISMLVLFFLSATYSIAQKQSTEAILQSFADSYQHDPMTFTAYFGIKVGEEWWYVRAERFQEAYQVGKNKQYTFHNYGPHKVSLHKGVPSQPTWYFDLDDKATLDKINEKIWTASTAAAKSTGADKVALNVRSMEGFTSSHKSVAASYLVMEHFWKKDAVEITRFSRDSSLPSHGADLVSLYTMKDKRIGWFSIGKDEAANADRGLDKSQVPNLLIFTKGRGKGEFGDGEVDIEPGMSVFIGPYIKHIIYNPYDEPLEGILVLYGDNIDYALGQSYLDFLEKEYEFYEENQKATKLE